ncbi:MAG: ferrous iron transport protein B, partial [Omnitrophica bacterium GWA2_50_21]
FQTSEKFTVSERMDQILTHRVWGLLFFMAIMGVIFQSIFTWAEFPMKALESAIKNLGSFTGGILPAGQLNSLVVDGMIAGVGNVVVFLPQIFLLFFFIALLEDFGYMARAAFVLDRIMKKVGLNGKAFLPLLSSFACAVPGVMATRTIENRSDRLATILVAPLMSCSARLPVYALMIGAFIPAGRFYGVFSYKAVTLFSLYFLSLLTGLGMAALFRRTLLKGNQTPFIFELPPYRLPNIKSVLRTMWDRGKEFIYRAGTIIFFISVILWFLASYPKDPAVEKNYQAQRQQLSVTLTGDALKTELANLERTVSGDRLKISFAGRLGQAIEPVIEPLGFNWKIGIGLIASFAAREVLVSTLAIVYNIGQDADEKNVDLISALQAEKDPVTGKPAYSPLVAISLMVFFVLACQCMSTLAIVRRETNTWGWPLFMFTYMTILAWVGSFLVYQGGRLLGF